ncbi:hypothetical protein NKH77_28765 [Streptomyces sp. M19]
MGRVGAWDAVAGRCTRRARVRGRWRWSWRGGWVASGPRVGGVPPARGRGVGGRVGPGGQRVSTVPPDLSAFDAQAVVINADGRVVADALPEFAESSSVAHSVVDAGIRDEYAAIGNEIEYRYPLQIAITAQMLRKFGVPIPLSGNLQDADLRKVPLATAPVSRSSSTRWSSSGTARQGGCTMSTGRIRRASTTRRVVHPGGRPRTGGPEPG